jgi:hypothetical protein
MASMTKKGCPTCGSSLKTTDSGRKHQAASDEPDAPVWRKILYEKQPFEDNHVPASFLASAVTNGEAKNNCFAKLFKSIVFQQM